MKKMIFMFVCAFCFCLLINSMTLALEDSNSVFSAEVSMDYFGKYIWRGIVGNDEPVFQPSVAVSYKNLTATVWGNADTTDYNCQKNEFTELDYILEYSGESPFEIEWLNYSIGAVHYSLMQDTNFSTTEIFGGLGINCLLNPAVKVYQDIDEADGATYAAFSLSHDVEKIAEIEGKQIGMSLGASLGWGNKKYNQYYWETKHSSLNDLTLSVSFPVELFGWTVSPNLNYATLMNNGLRSSDAYSKKSDYFFAGLNVSKEF